jgi:hypothetical protein
MKNLKSLLVTIVTTLSMPQIANAQDYSSYSWTKLSIPYSNTYVDWTKIRGDKERGFMVPILNSYDEITSAQMWGLSEISNVSIGCLQGSMQFLNTTWTESRMGRGRVMKTFTASPVIYPQTKNYEYSYPRNLFNNLCRR